MTPDWHSWSSIRSTEPWILALQTPIDRGTWFAGCTTTTIKEAILRKAWKAWRHGVPVKILPDISRAIVQRWALLHPVLDLAHQLGITYCWGFPLSATFFRDQQSFTLCTPEDLPPLFAFMESDPIPVSKWLISLPQPVVWASRHPAEIPRLDCRGHSGVPECHPQRVYASHNQLYSPLNTRFPPCSHSTWHAFLICLLALLQFYDSPLYRLPLHYLHLLARLDMKLKYVYKISTLKDVAP